METIIDMNQVVMGILGLLSLPWLLSACWIIGLCIQRYIWPAKIVEWVIIENDEEKTIQVSLDDTDRLIQFLLKAKK